MAERDKMFFKDGMTDKFSEAVSRLNLLFSKFTFYADSNFCYYRQSERRSKNFLGSVRVNLPGKLVCAGGGGGGSRSLNF